MAVTLNNPYSDSVFTVLNTIRSVSYTVPVGTKCLYILIYTDNSNASVVLPDLVDYAGVSATLVSAIPSDVGGTGQLHFLYEITNPTTGANNLRFRHPSLATSAAAVCLSVDQNYIETVSSFSYANSANPSVSIASASGDVTLYSLTVNNVGTTAIAETGGQTVLSEGGSASNAMHQLSIETASGTPNSATWTVSGGAQRWSAISINIREIAQSLIISTPLVPNASRTDTCTGYADGAATLSFSGVSIPVTITSNSFTYTVPMLADSVVWPRLPATGQTITLTQGVLVATTAADINLPIGYNRLRDGSNNVANFAGLIADDNTYLQFHFVSSGDALTTNDTAYHVTSNNYVLLQSSGINVDTDSLPRTDTLYIHRASGVIGAHSITINAAGDIVSFGGLSVAGLSNYGLTVSGPSVTGL